MPPDPRVEWSDEIAVVEAQAPLAELLALLGEDGPPYYIVLRRAADLLYVFLGTELARVPGIRRYREAEPPTGLTIVDAIDLHEDDSSGRKRYDGSPLPYPYPEPVGRRPQPSRGRFVMVDDGDRPIAAGEEEGAVTLRGGRRPPAFEARILMAGPPPDPPAGPPADEGTAVTRYPSLAADREPAAGASVVVTVDLLQERRDTATESQGVTIEDLPFDWSALDVQVDLVSSAIDFAQPTGVVTVRRNAASVPATFSGTVRAGLSPGKDVTVKAFFSHGGRTCGMATRVFTTGQAERAGLAPAPGTPLVVETRAEPAVLTVHILRPDMSAPSKLFWILKVPRADAVPGLPDRLSAPGDLPGEPAAYTAQLYQSFAGLSPGGHTDFFRGAGDELWARTPDVFRRTYWALRDSIGASFSIQFVTDDPHIPWELMRPHRKVPEETADLLAIEHPVARWIAEYEGHLRQQLPAGRVVTIAPKYRSANDVLPRAQDEADLLTHEFSAASVAGTAAGVKQLLREGLGGERIAVVHFAGHGEFKPGMPGASSIKLEDGSLTALEVGAVETKLGERDGPLVVFNACQVGVSGEALGVPGGWAAAFLKRRFRGFVAPLWAIYDEDAPVVVKELFEAVVTRHEPLGQALQQIRARHGASSPTFLAYLYYGDVLARFPAA